MARIRSIKPEFWSDRSLAKLSPFARLLYIALWNHADEHGRVHGDPRWVKGHCLPYDDSIEPDDIERLIDELGPRRVLRYIVDGDPYLFLPKLGKHQRLEATKVPSRLPAPPGDDDPRDPAEGGSNGPPDGSSDAPDDPLDGPSESRANKSARRADSSGRIVALHVAGSMEHVAGSSDARAGTRTRARGTPPPTPPPQHPAPIRQLRQKLEGARLIVRWDKLDNAQLSEITSFVDVHGPERLVKAATTAYQPNNPPAFAQAWLNLWRHLPPPGEHVRVVAEPCRNHLLPQPCRSCAADRKAAVP